MRIDSTGQRSAWAALAVLFAAVCVYFLLPGGSVAQAVVYSVIGFAAAAALAFGPARRAAGGARLPWFLLAAGLACFTVGDSLFSYYEQTGAAPLPSAADVLYLGAYPLLLAGVVLLGRARGRRLRFALADALVASAAFAVVQWVFVMEPLASEESGLARAVLLAYPAMDLLLAAALASLLFTPAWRAPAVWLLAGGILLLLVGDEIYLGIGDTYTAGSWVDAFWLTSYALFAGAALHPSALQLRQPAHEAAPLSWARVLLLGGALAAVPVALVFAHPGGLELAILALGAAGLSMVVLLRIVDLVRFLAAENARLRELDRLKDEFLGLVSHDLRTPLTSIAGYTELLLDDPDGTLGDDRRTFLRVIDRNARRLQRLLDDLLFEARLEAGLEGLELREVDVAQLARQCVEESRTGAEEAGLALELDAPAPAAVVADDARLSQVLDNLVSNALKFTPAGGRVDVSVARANGSVAVEVSDTGIGIASGEAARLFDRFFRGSNARSRQLPGTGLGLHIVQAIVDAHGGTISVESGEDAGTTFRIELPLSPPAAGSGSRSL